jgi:hypothetical protein
MNKKIIAIVALLVFGVFAFISSCKKNTTSLPLEPISLIQPDSGIIRAFTGSSNPIQIAFTTDRPINWVRGLVDIDTLIDSTHYTPTFPDTLFAIRLDTVNPRINLYTYTGSYKVPDTIPAFSVIRFRISFEAGSVTFKTGQNYPQGLVSTTKEFKFNVR